LLGLADEQFGYLELTHSEAVTTASQDSWAARGCGTEIQTQESMISRLSAEAVRYLLGGIIRAAIFDEVLQHLLRLFTREQLPQKEHPGIHDS
jgi:hypothetical protein